MPAELIEQKGNTVKVQFTLELTGQMLRDEEALQQVINEAGQAAMVPILKQFDTHGEPIRVNSVKHTVSCVLALRTLKLTTGRWQQFWSYVMRHGCTLS